MVAKRQYDALDVVLMITLAARIHGTDAAVRATAKSILKKIPQADRHGVRRFITTKYPLRVAEMLLDALVVVQEDNQRPQ
jgi:hypothetical protein